MRVEAAFGLLVASWVLVAGPAAGAPVAPAPQTIGPVPERTLELAIRGSGGSYEINVHPDVVTMLYLPEPPTRMFASDARQFELHATDTQVAIRPRPAPQGTRGTVSLDTSGLHLSIVLRVSAFEEAKAQVFFRRDGQRVADAPCQKRLDGLTEELARTRSGLGAEAETRAHAHLARAIAREVATWRPEGTSITRNHAGIVLWIETVARVGEDLWVRVGLENRDRAPFTIAGMDLVASSSEAPIPVTAGWERTQVGFGERVYGAARLGRSSDLLRRASLGVRVRESNGRRDVSLIGLRVEP